MNKGKLGLRWLETNPRPQQKPQTLESFLEKNAYTTTLQPTIPKDKKPFHWWQVGRMACLVVVGNEVREA